MTAILSTYCGFARINGPIWRMIAKKRLRDGKEDPARIEEKFGYPSCARPNGPLLWCHGASVGETLAILGVVERFLEDHPEAHVLVTSGTITSAEILQKRLPARAVHQFLPYDNVGFWQRFLRHWAPDLCVFTESDLWPAMMRQVQKAGVPMVLIGGRVSETTRAIWQKYPKSARALLGMLDQCQVQSQDLAEDMIALGLDPAQIEVTGFIKQDLKPLPYDAEALEHLVQAFGDRRMWCAASTHPGEEELMLEAHQRLGVDDLLILVPRHPERATEIEQLLQDRGMSYQLRSQTAEAISGQPQVYLADTVGEMGLWYRLCDVAFIGGSLVPVGGHNPYEPALLDCAIIHGPMVHNFEIPYEQLTRDLAAITVCDSTGLAEAVTLLWTAPQDITERAKAALTPKTSATDAATVLIAGYFKG